MNTAATGFDQLVASAAPGNQPGRHRATTGADADPVSQVWRASSRHAERARLVGPGVATALQTTLAEVSRST